MSKRVLTIDDSKTLRLIVGKYLKPFGVGIIEADNGAVGIEKAKAENPDLILLDYNMPVMDGLQTLEGLKKDPALRPIPVVMLTTETVKETVIKLIKLGLKDYIAKPFTREALVQKLNPILGLYEGDMPSEVDLAAMATQAQPQGSIPDKPAVLIVDDKDNVIKLLREYLGEGYNVVAAANGHTALARIQQGTFDSIFLDMDLPDISGIELYKKVKKQLEAMSAKVVGMSLRTQVTEITQAKQLGIREFLYKPFSKGDVEELAAMLMYGKSAAGAGDAPRKFLVADGNIRILSFPDEKDPSLKAFASALSAEIRQEVSEMADEGVTRLIVKLSPGLMSDFGSVKKFVSLLDHVQRLTLSVRLVADTDKTKEQLRQYSEMANLKTYDSVDLAAASFG
jgi:two-component system cell cycle response regulator